MKNEKPNKTCFVYSSSSDLELEKLLLGVAGCTDRHCSVSETSASHQSSMRLTSKRMRRRARYNPRKQERKLFNKSSSFNK
jgi:hypothetical protein